MPVPTIPPMTSMVESNSPSRRARDGDELAWGCGVDEVKGLCPGTGIVSSLPGNLQGVDVVDDVDGVDCRRQHIARTAAFPRSCHNRCLPVERRADARAA